VVVAVAIKAGESSARKSARGRAGGRGTVVVVSGGDDDQLAMRRGGYIARRWPGSCEVFGSCRKLGSPAHTARVVDSVLNSGIDQRSLEVPPEQ
jgi:hypothetical protein